MVALRQQAGFSLIEIIAVLVIISLIMALTVTSITRSLDSTRVRVAAKDITSALRYTRGQAILSHEEQTLDFDLDKKTYQAPGKDAVELPEGLELKLLTARDEVSSENVGKIRFFPDGSSTGGRVTVLAGEREWRINVGWLTGEIQLWDPHQERT